MTTEQQQDWARKIDALLRKAEASKSPEEAEAFISKAQALMTKFAIDEAMLEANRRKAGKASDFISEEEFVMTGSFRVAFGNLCYYIIKYNDCEAVLLQNSPRTVEGKLYKQTYILKVTGFQQDIDRVRLLYTSLQLQAIRFETAWWKENRHVYDSYPRQGFLDRRQFLFSFAHAVGARVKEGYLRGKQEAQKQHGTGMELVLRDKKEMVLAEYNKRHPNLRSGKQRQAGGSYDSHVAGQSAGNKADIGQPTFKGGQKELR